MPFSKSPNGLCELQPASLLSANLGGASGRAMRSSRFMVIKQRSEARRSVKVHMVAERLVAFLIV